MVWSQVEEYKNAGQSGIVYEIQAPEPNKLATEVQFHHFFLSNKCLRSAHGVAVSCYNHE